MNATKVELISAVLGLLDDDRLDLVLTIVASLRPGVVPPVASKDESNGFPSIGSEAWGQMNQRRGELIWKKNREGLSAEEQAEYERLQALTGEALQKTFPAPPFDDEKLTRLETRLKARVKE